MGLFDKFKKNNCQTDNFKLLSNWIDKVLENELPNGVVAYNFNIYEGSKGTYDIQLIGSDEFNEDDTDWACSDYFSTGEDICLIQKTYDIEHWEKGLNYLKKLVEQYLN